MLARVLAPFLTLGLAPLAAPQGAPPSPPGGANVQVSSPDSSAQWMPTIAVDPTDRLHLVAAAADARGTGQAAYYASFDGGGTWNEWFDTSPSGPAAAAFGFAGELYFSTNHLDSSGNRVLCVGRSYDGGLSVSSWATTFTFGSRGGADLPTLAVDRSQGPYAGSVYLAFGYFDSGTARIWVAASHDGGQSWTSKPVNGNSTHNVAEATLAVDSSGVVHVAWYDITKGSIHVDASSDGGATWGADVFVENAVYYILPGDPNQNRVLPFPRIAADTSGGPYDGNLYVVWATDGGSGGPDVVLSTSSDGGQTWSTPILASDVATNSQFTPCVDVDPNGNVNLGFYDSRDDASNVRVHYYVSRSSDGGATIEPNVRASDADFVPTYYTVGVEDRIGIAVSDRTVHAIWTDARNGDNDIYGAAVEFDFHTDVAELSAGTGGTVAFSVQPGPLYQNDAYWILGSASGTTPGIDLYLVHLPLDYDAFTLWTIVAANSSVLPGFAGNLDATGAAPASLVSGPLPPALVGFQMDFAALVKSGPAFRWSSNATHLAIGN